MARRQLFHRPSTHPEFTPKYPYFLHLHNFLRWGISLGITQAILLFPAQAAEQITFHYNHFNFIISLQDLETSLATSEASNQAQETSVDRNIKRSITPSELSPRRSPLEVLSPQFSIRLAQLLNQPLPSLPSPQLANLLSAPTVTSLLHAAGELIQDQQKENGATALKAAIMDAAASPEGLTGLNVIRHFPGEIHWDARQTLALWQRHQQLRQKTSALMHSLDQQVMASASGPSSRLRRKRRRLPNDPRLPGEIGFQIQELNLWDQRRDRQFKAHLYLPQPSSPEQFLVQQSNPDHASAKTSTEDAHTTPLVVMSHGLAASLQSRAFLAEHLASHGIAVAMVQHPGSDIQQFQALLQGKAGTVAAPQAFIDRPQDIHFLLDELTRRSRSNSSTLRTAGYGDDSLAHHHLQLERVVMFGHSFGAYTALAVAGADINFAQLQQDCQDEAMLLDLSLLLQCRALELDPTQVPSFKDERIAALMVVDPMSRSIFGKRELQRIEMPLFWSGAQRDPLTPLVLSQLPAFDWLSSPHKYLSVIEAASHINLQPRSSAFSQPAPSQPSLQAIVAPPPQPIKDYTNALGLAFIQTHLLRDDSYRSYLQPDYIRELSQTPYYLRLLPPNVASRTPSLLSALDSFSLKASPSQASKVSHF